MSTEKKEIRYWFSARQVCQHGQGSVTGGVRYHSGWCFGKDEESAKLSATNDVKRTRELCPNSFTPDHSIAGTLIEYSLVADNADAYQVIDFCVNL